MTDRPTVSAAMARAEAAHAKILSHEELCAERYRAIFDGLGDLKAKSDSHSKLLWGVLLSIAGFLAVTMVAVVLKAVGLA
jgi:hypothetical protein